MTYVAAYSPHAQYVNPRQVMQAKKHQNRHERIRPPMALQKRSQLSLKQLDRQR